TGLVAALVKIEGENGDVVALGASRGVAGESSDGVEQTGDEIGGCKIPVSLQELFAALFSKFFLGKVGGFNQTGPEKQEARAGSNRDFCVGVFGFGKEAKHEAAFRKFDNRS